MISGVLKTLGASAQTFIAELEAFLGDVLEFEGAKFIDRRNQHLVHRF